MQAPAAVQQPCSSKNVVIGNAELQQLLARIAQLERGPKLPKIPVSEAEYDPERPTWDGEEVQRYRIPKLTTEQKLNKILSDLNFDIVKSSKRAVYRINQLKH